eukprot:2594335-Prymnesium_polylepis.1
MRIFVASAAGTIQTSVVSPHASRRGGDDLHAGRAPPPCQQPLAGGGGGGGDSSSSDASRSSGASRSVSPAPPQPQPLWAAPSCGGED